MVLIEKTIKGRIFAKLSFAIIKLFNIKALNVNDTITIGNGSFVKVDEELK